MESNTFHFRYPPEVDGVTEEVTSCEESGQGEGETFTDKVGVNLCMFYSTLGQDEHLAFCVCSEVTSPSSITPALRVGEGVTVEFKLAVLKQCVHVWCVECVV